MPDEPKDPNEFTGETIDEAVARGREALGLAPNQYMVEVLEEPRSGVFGIGSRPARVRIKAFGPPPSATPPTPAPPTKPQAAPHPVQDDHSHDALAAIPLPDAADESTLDDEARVGRDVLLDLLAHLGFEGPEVHVSRSDSGHEQDEDGDQGDERDAEHNDAPWLLNVTGAHSHTLVGKKGETLAALQYITRLIVSRRLQRRASLVIDADNYKAQRAERLNRLALRMAEQAIANAGPITLEPMPPHERRMIHMTLRHHEHVYTKSTGEGSSRKVMIVPKDSE